MPFGRIGQWDSVNINKVFNSSGYFTSSCENRWRARIPPFTTKWVNPISFSLFLFLFLYRSDELPSTQASQYHSSQTQVPLSQLSGGILSNTVRAHTFVTLGKMCLQEEGLAKRCIAAMARELETSKDPAVRNNVTVVMCDLCIRWENWIHFFYFFLFGWEFCSIWKGTFCIRKYVQFGENFGSLGPWEIVIFLIFYVLPASCMHKVSNVSFLQLY